MNQKVMDMSEWRSQFLKIKIRPQRIAVLISVDAKWTQLQSLIRFLSFVWGGRYCAIIPINLMNNKDNHLASRWLSNYDPDIVLLASGMNGIDLEELLKKTCTPFSVNRLYDDLSDNFRFNLGGVISTSGIIKDFIKEINTQNTMSRFQIVSCSEDAPESFLYHVMFGVFSKDEAKSLASDIKGQAVHMGKESSISDYIHLFTKTDSPLTPLDLGSRNIYTELQQGPNPPTIYLGTSSVVDVAYFWNIRASSLQYENNILYINKKAIDDEEAINALVKWVCLPRPHIKSTYCRILSYSITSDHLQRLAKRLRLRVKNYGVNHVDVDKPDLEIHKIFFHRDETTIETQMIDKRTIEFKIPSFPLGGQECLVIELFKSVFSNRYLFDHMPPFVSINSNYEVLNAPSPAYRVLYGKTLLRYFNGMICRKVDKNTSIVRITIPNSFEIFTSYLSSLGVKDFKDEKRLCYEAIINMIGSFSEAAKCFIGKSRAILLAFEDKTLKFNQIQSKVKFGNIKKSKKEYLILSRIESSIRKKIAEQRWESNEHFFFNSGNLKDILYWLVERKILIRRILLPKCDNCLKKDSWTDRLDLRTPPSCPNCGAQLMLTDKVNIGYQLDPLARRAFDEGFIPIILTLRFLKNLTEVAFMYIPGFKGKIDGENFDIDIIASCDGVLIFCECKTLMEKKPSKKDWQYIKDQFENLIRKARKFNAQVVILSSLRERYPKMLTDLVKKHSDESLAIVLLNKEDLEKGWRFSKISEVDMRLSISHFLPKEKKVKKKRRRGTRKITFGDFLNAKGKSGKAK